jgi:hypothetical protein
MTANVETFSKNKFVIVRNFLNPDLVKFLASYFQRAEGGIEAIFERDWTSLNAHSDACGDTVMYFIKPAIEENTGLELLPTYSFVRMYRKGDSLGRHKDGKQNQISCTMCIERDADWPLGISDGDKDHSVILEPGDAVIYQGYAVEHWRDKFSGNRQVQLITAFVEKGGKHDHLRYYSRGEPMYIPTGVKRAGPVRLAKSRLVKLKDKLFKRDTSL